MCGWLVGPNDRTPEEHYSLRHKRLLADREYAQEFANKVLHKGNEDALAAKEASKHGGGDGGAELLLHLPGEWRRQSFHKPVRQAQERHVPHRAG